MVNNYPEAFVRDMEHLLGKDAAHFFSSLEQQPLTAVRKNPFKHAAVFDHEEQVEWCADGRYLAERPSFIADPFFHAGAYYVQESSSMFLHHLLKQVLSSFHHPVKVLDLCAAPGGKSTLISSLLKGEDLLVSNEIIRSRVDVLEENLMRWGASNVFISNNDPKDFTALVSFFDVILVDAPCSGEGLFRKDKKAVNEWSAQQVDLCTARQQRILADVLPALKPGGFLIYSTCTFNQKENENNIRWMRDELNLQQVAIKSDPQWPVEADEKGASFRFWPHRVKGEGLFMTCLQKPVGMGISQPAKFREQPLSFVHRKNKDELKGWLNLPDRFDFIEWNGIIHAILQNQVADLKVLAKYLHLKNAGINMGELMKEKLLPSHHLALSNELSHSVQSIGVNREEAQKYLKKDTLLFKEKHEQGIRLLRYEGLGIGWVKVLQNRVNNYLPTHLRILKDIS